MANDAGIISERSSRSVKETMNQLEAVLRW